MGVHRMTRADLGDVLLDVAFELRRQRRIARRHAVVGGALEHGKVRGGLGDHRRGLDAGRAGADQADALAGEIDALVRPLAGVVPAPLEAFEARECSGRSPSTGSRPR